MSPDLLSELLSLYGDQIQSHTSDLDRADVKGVLTSLADLCLLVPDVLDGAAALFDAPRQIDFFRIVLEESIAGFLHRYRSTAELTDITEDVIGRSITLLHALPIDASWMLLYRHCFQIRGRPGDFLVFIPRLAELVSEPDVLDGLLGICECGLDLVSNGEDSETDAYAENVIRIILSIDTSFRQMPRGWTAIFGYAPEFFLDESRRGFAASLLEKFVGDLPQLLQGEHCDLCFESFATLVTQDADFLRFGFEFVEFVIQAIQERAILLPVERSVVWGSLSRVLACDAAATSSFFADAAPSPGLFFCAAAVTWAQDADVIHRLLEGFFAIDVPDAFIARQFLESVARHTRAAAFVPAIAQFVAATAPASGLLLCALCVHHADAVVANYPEVRPFVAGVVAAEPFARVVPFILAMWHLGDVEVLGDVVQREAVIRMGNTRAVCRFLESFRTLIRNAPARMDFHELFDAVAEIAVALPDVDVQLAIGDVVEDALIKDWVGDVEFVRVWIEATATQFGPFPAHFRLLAAIREHPGEAVIAAIQDVEPNGTRSSCARCSSTSREWSRGTRRSSGGPSQWTSYSASSTRITGRSQPRWSRSRPQSSRTRSRRHLMSTS
jgi:hypothetical protein